MKTQFTLLATITLMMLGCTKTEPSQEENRAIKLSRYGVSIFAGCSSIIDVESDGDFSLLEENPDIASGWWSNDGKTIEVITHDVGITNIIVKNRATNKSVKIIVASIYFSGNYQDKVLNNDRPVVTALVQAQDQSVVELISSELITTARQSAWDYHFVSPSQYSIPQSNSLLMVSKITGERFTGTYEWTPTSLILHYDGKTKVYGFKSNGDGRIFIESDLTSEYQRLYPDAHVMCAKIRRTLINQQRLL